MGTWDSYCALCSGPLENIRPRVGPNRAYDPHLIREVEWLERVRCLGFNDGTNKAYISGYSELSAHGCMLLTPGNDPNQPEGITEQSAYQGPDCVLPFHDICYDILTDIIIDASDSKDRECVDRFMLYLAMRDLVGDSPCTLDIGCLQVSGAEQFWQQQAGEEYTVAQPEFVDEVQSAIMAKLLDGSFSPRDDSIFASRQRDSPDPFRTLPTEIIGLITRYLPVKDILVMSSTSLPFLTSTSSASLWKSLLRREMAWAAKDVEKLVELAFQGADSQLDEDSKEKSVTEGLQRSVSRDVDYKALMLWLNHAVRPINGVSWPWLHLANRRRIWRVCHVVANEYWDVMGDEMGGDFEDKKQDWPDSLMGEGYYPEVM